MPYQTVPTHLKGLTIAQANRWGEVYDSMKAVVASDEFAARVAWAVVNNMR